MDAVISCRAGSCDQDGGQDRLILYFGGSYREKWSKDYTLAIQYEGRKSVDAVCTDGV